MKYERWNKPQDPEPRGKLSNLGPTQSNVGLGIEKQKDSGFCFFFLFLAFFFSLNHGGWGSFSYISGTIGLA